MVHHGEMTAEKNSSTYIMYFINFVKCTRQTPHKITILYPAREHSDSTGCTEEPIFDDPRHILSLDKVYVKC